MKKSIFLISLLCFFTFSIFAKITIPEELNYPQPTCQIKQSKILDLFSDEFYGIKNNIEILNNTICEIKINFFAYSDDNKEWNKVSEIISVPSSKKEKQKISDISQLRYLAVTFGNDDSEVHYKVDFLKTGNKLLLKINDYSEKVLLDEYNIENDYNFTIVGRTCVEKNTNYESNIVAQRLQLKHKILSSDEFTSCFIEFCIDGKYNFGPFPLFDDQNLSYETLKVINDADYGVCIRSWNGQINPLIYKRTKNDSVDVQKISDGFLLYFDGKIYKNDILLQENFYDYKYLAEIGDDIYYLGKNHSLYKNDKLIEENVENIIFMGTDYYCRKNNQGWTGSQIIKNGKVVFDSSISAVCDYSDSISDFTVSFILRIVTVYTFNYYNLSFTKRNNTNM